MSQPPIVGPEGLWRHYAGAMEAALQKTGTGAEGFELRLEEITPSGSREVNGVRVTAARVRHGKDEHGPFLGYRLELDGRILAYSGDTEWMNSLTGLGRDADLMICECSFLTPKGRFHLDLATLRENLPGVGGRRRPDSVGRRRLQRTIGTLSGGRRPCAVTGRCQACKKWGSRLHQRGVGRNTSPQDYTPTVRTCNGSGSSASQLVHAALLRGA